MCGLTSTQPNQPNDESVKILMRKKNYSTASNEHGSTKPYKFNVEVADGSTSSTSSLIVFQLLIRCVHPWAMRHPRTWSAVARSLTVVSSSDYISACITVSMIIVDGLVDKHKEQVFPKDEFTESMIS